MTKEIDFFRKQLMEWHRDTNDRELPWKADRDPYKIWLSEVIMQQTQVRQGLPYYLHFIDKYPTVEDLANADEGDVYRSWQGLGYYNRCKNLLHTARYIAKELKGKFPINRAEWLLLKGIGPYTASAITSFAYGAPHAVVDGNVQRVISRYYQVEEPIDVPLGAKIVQDLADLSLDRAHSDLYNQAIMDLGAMVCTPRKPLCERCPLKIRCKAYANQLTSVLPIKQKKLIIRTRYFNYVLFETAERISVSKRSEGDIWEGLYEPYLIESRAGLTKDEVARSLTSAGINASGIEYTGEMKQRLTHQWILSRFYRIVLENEPSDLKILSWVEKENLGYYAFPKTIVSYFTRNGYF